MYTGLAVGIPEGLGTTEFLTGGGYTRGGLVYWGGYTRGWVGIPRGWVYQGQVYRY